MRSSNQSLFDLFERERRYVVPLFQRQYVWGREEQWEPLWDDIRGRAEALLEETESSLRGQGVGDHFLGAVVLKRLDVFGREVAAYEVIDGQQRLTTLQILLAAFRDVTRELKADRLPDDLQRLVENGGTRQRDEEGFKVWPTNDDRKTFKIAMTAGSPERIDEEFPTRRKKYARNDEPRPRLIEAYLYLHKEIENFCTQVSSNGDAGTDSVVAMENVSERAHKLYEAIRRHLQIVVIELEEFDDPQVIFETMNARGVPLLPSDLIRNFIFLNAMRQGADVQILYDSWWKEYDERPADDDKGDENRFWKRLEGRGQARRTRLDLFVYHYLQYRSAQDYGVAHLFEAFRKWWNVEPDRDVSEELRRLREHSDAFASLMVPTADDRVGVFATRLKVLDTSTVYPLLLLLLVEGRGRTEPDELDGIMEDLESYLVRRMVCDLGTKNYNRFFFSLLGKLRDTESITRDLVQRHLMSPDGPAGDWPDDKQFGRAWLEKPIYSASKSRRVMMLLDAIEKSSRHRMRESVKLESTLTVEHVMPQKPTAGDWEEPRAFEGVQDETPDERRDRLLHTMGNLTLLTRELNSSVSNGPYERKRPEIARQSALQLNSYFQEQKSWDEEQILVRGKTLLEEALRVWPHPDGQIHV